MFAKVLRNICLLSVYCVLVVKNKKEWRIYSNKVSDLTAEGFERLLERLDKDQMRAAERYEELRLKLIKCFVWRGCTNLYADNLADTTLDRVAKKLGEGVEIESVNAYACEISRYVWMEHLRKNKEDAKDDEQMPLQTVDPEIPEDPDERLKCLRKCLPEVSKDETDKQLIIGYYDTKHGEKNKDIRRKLAETLGVTMNTLKVKALRLRNRLENCINECMAEIA